MAVDKEVVVRDYYGGEAVVLYTPIEQLPESSRELYTYNPDKAKRLLAEAGYPGGFKFSVLTRSDFVDMMSIIKDYLAKVGVDMELDVRDSTVWSSMRTAKTYKYAVATTYSALPYDMKYWITPPGGAYNYYMGYDTHVRELTGQIWMWENIENQAGKDRLAKEATLYVISQAWLIDYPTPYLFAAWWPWVKNHYGINTLGFTAGDFKVTPEWIWLDQELKEKMTGSR